MRTNEALRIFWHGDEVPGLTFYAYVWQKRQRPSFPMEVWPGGSEVRNSELRGSGWLVWVWDLRVDRWPLDLRNDVHATLKHVSGNNGIVAWCALEGCFAEPPDLLDPDAMAGGVYAAISSGTGFLCHSDIDDEFRSLGRSELTALRAQLNVPAAGGANN